MTLRFNRTTHLLILAASFIVSVVSLSNLTTLLFQMAIEGLTIWNGLLGLGYLAAIILTVTILARAMYRLDSRAGRIRNRVKWFDR